LEVVLDADELYIVSRLDDVCVPSLPPVRFHPKIRPKTAKRFYYRPPEPAANTAVVTRV
jgi:hypothetical protein